MKSFTKNDFLGFKKITVSACIVVDWNVFECVD